MMKMLTVIRSVAKCISIEPAMFLYFVSLTLSALAGQNLILQKVCHPGDSAPPPLKPCDDEEATHKVVTSIETWKSVILHAGPVLFLLFAGSWSDVHGRCRKPLMWLPLCGQVVSDLLCILNVYNWSWSPQLYAASQSVLPSLTGWRPCFVTGMNGYLTDSTDKEYRTVRYGINTAIFFIGSPVGAFLFGLIFKNISFVGVLSLCIVLNLYSLAHLIFLVPDRQASDNMIALKWWEGLVNLKNVKDSIKLFVKPREGYNRAILLLILAVAPLVRAPLDGEFSVSYLFLRIVFHWTAVDFGLYAGYKCIVIFFGTIVSMWLFSRLLSVPDAMIGVMASVTLMVASTGFAFITATWQLFVYCLVDFMHGAGFAVQFSILSKTVDGTEIGKASAMLGVLDTAFPMINLPLYSQTYNHTLTQMPGAFFLLSVMYGAITLVLFGSIYYLQSLQTVRGESRKDSTSLPQCNAVAI